ncbi:M61 family metallopeptidase [Aquirufa sp. ROCK-SH2]
MNIQHFRLKSFLLISILFLSISSLTFGGISHQVAMPEPHTHYFEVTTRVDLKSEVYKKSYLDLKMAAWTPGSYLIREFARNVESLSASSNGKSLAFQKINKNTWRIQLNKDQLNGIIDVKYKVYAFELSVRTSFLDDTHGYINPASVLLYMNDFKNKAQEIEIIPFKNFKKVSTALKEIGQFKYQAKNLDELIDSPIEIGNHKIFEFNVGNIPHQIAFYGPAKVDSVKFLKDVKKMCETAQNVVGEHPCDHYLFIIHNLYRGGGGLEHLNSTTCQVSRGNYETDKGYKGILNLLAHEYFHLWNVKRIRPIALGPFDYENENYTHNLWFSEGITSYYADLISQRSGLISNSEYLTALSEEISAVENQPGNKVESAAESSWDAWIKYYRPNENSKNSSISYYDKGSVLGGILNLWIIQQTNGKKRLDDVFSFLYSNYFKKLQRGFTDAELEDAFSKVAGNSAKNIFVENIYGIKTPNYKELFASVGYQWTNSNEGKQISFLGLTVTSNKITQLYKGGPAYQFGLNVGDEILKVNNLDFEGVEKLLVNKKPNETILFTIKRDGIERNIMVTIAQSPIQSFVLTSFGNLTESQSNLRKAWLGSL